MRLARTPREMMAAIQGCMTDAEAKKLIRQEVASVLAENSSLMEDQVRKALLDGVGYAAAYFSRAEAARICAIFHVTHPVYGRVEDWPEGDDLFAVARMAAVRDAGRYKDGHA